jgi:GT2 family glycosyltransferase
MFPEIWRSDIRIFQAIQMFFCPSAVMAYPDGIDFLKSQAFFYYGHGHPQASLSVFKSVSGNPCGSPWKLNVIQNYEVIREICFVKETHKGEKIRLIYGYHHFFS